MTLRWGNPALGMSTPWEIISAIPLDISVYSFRIRLFRSDDITNDGHIRIYSFIENVFVSWSVGRGETHCDHCNSSEKQRWLHKTYLFNHISTSDYSVLNHYLFGKDYSPTIKKYMIHFIWTMWGWTQVSCLFVGPSHFAFKRLAVLDTRVYLHYNPWLTFLSNAQNYSLF